MSNSTCTQVAFGEEATFGTAAASYVKSAFMEGGLVANNAIIITTENNGVIGAKDPIAGPYMGEGGLNMLGRVGGINPLLLKALMGDVTTTALGGGAYRHVFTTVGACSELPSLTFYEDLLTQKKRWKGVKVGGLTVDQPVDREMTMNWTMIGKVDETTTDPSATEYNPKPLSYADLTVTLNGSEDDNFESVSFSIDNALDPRRTLNGSRTISGASPTDFAITGSFTREFIDVLLQERFWGAVGATGPTNIVLPNTLALSWVSTQQIGSSGQYYTITFDFKRLIITSAQPTLPNRARIMEPIEFVCVNNDSNQLLEVTIINAESAIGI